MKKVAEAKAKTDSANNSNSSFGIQYYSSHPAPKASEYLTIGINHVVYAANFADLINKLNSLGRTYSIYQRSAGKISRVLDEDYLNYYDGNG